MKKLNIIIEWGFYLFLFLLPWQTRLIWQDAFLNKYVWEYGRFSLYGTELLLWAVLFFYLIWIFKNQKLKKLNWQNITQRLKNPAILIYWLIVGFVLFSGLTILWSLNAQLTYYNWFRLAEAVALMAMVLNFSFSFKRIAIVWSASAVIQSVFAIWQFFVQCVPANKWFGLAFHESTLGGSIILQTNVERWLRAYGSLPHPNILAGFLVIAVLFLLYLAMQAKNRGQRMFVITGIITTVPAIFFTFSRSAWVALICSLIILAIWVYKKKEKFYKHMFLKTSFLIVLILVILGVSLFGPLSTRLRGEQDLEVASIHLRVEFTKQAMEIIKNRPIAGVGIGNYTLGVYNFVNGSWPGYYYQAVHNIYLLVLAELGIIGALMFYLILGLLFWFGVLKKGRREFELKEVIMLLALISILIISLFDHYFWTMYFGIIIFWLVLGLNLKRLRME